MLLYTDGVIEARNRSGAFYPLAERLPGWSRLRPQALVEGHPQRPAAARGQRPRRRRDHGRGAPRPSDLALRPHSRLPVCPGAAGRAGRHDGYARAARRSPGTRRGGAVAMSRPIPSRPASSGTGHEDGRSRRPS
ncbi:hypothetical protein [Streptomyces sp. NPDC058424]|uniref:hypothetical protein n=1 Tax=Streptomyces sp. NPDC058424 TaxID=3346491 RepID=UPI003656F981